MKVDFRKWSLTDKKELMELCNTVDRTFLSDRLPNPYIDDDADWWRPIILLMKFKRVNSLFLLRNYRYGKA